MTMDYTNFIENLHIAQTGETAEARNRANNKLLELRDRDPDRYERYTQKVRKAVKGLNIVKC